MTRRPRRFWTREEDAALLAGCQTDSLAQLCQRFRRGPAAIGARVALLVRNPPPGLRQPIPQHTDLHRALFGGGGARP